MELKPENWSEKATKQKFEPVNENLYIEEYDDSAQKAGYFILGFIAWLVIAYIISYSDRDNLMGVGGISMMFVDIFLSYFAYIFVHQVLRGIFDPTVKFLPEDAPRDPDFHKRYMEADNDPSNPMSTGMSVGVGMDADN